MCVGRRSPLCNSDQQKGSFPASHPGDLHAQVSFYQYYGSGMIYSGSGSSYEFLEFRFRILPILFMDIWKIIKENTLKSNYFPFSISHYTQSYSLESSGLKPISKILIYLLFHSCWIRIRINYSGSRKKFRILPVPDPDPQHWTFYTTESDWVNQQLPLSATGWTGWSTSSTRSDRPRFPAPTPAAQPEVKTIV